VQTPTLALIVKRQKEIAEFVPKDSWELHTLYHDDNFTYTGDRLEKEADGQSAVDVVAQLPLEITSVAKKKGR